MRRSRSTTLIASAAVLAAVLTGCGTTSSGTGTGTTSAATGAGTEAQQASVVADAVAGITVEQALADNLAYATVDTSWDEDAAVTVELADDGTSAGGEGVEIDGDTVTLTAAGTYVLRGELTDGQVVVDVPDDGDVTLVLDGASVTSTTTAPLQVAEAGSVLLVLADGSDNTLADTADTAGATDTAADADTEEPDAALFSTADLTIAGDGALTVLGRRADGIASKDGLVVAGGTLTVTAADDGIRGKDYLVVLDGDVTVTATADGLKSTEDEDATAGYVAVLGGEVSVEAGEDGVQAETDAILGGGTVTVSSGGGAGAALADDASGKGVKGTVSVVVGGDAVLVADSADDAVHSDGIVSVTGGELTLATGDDGVHADGDVTLAGGTVAVTASVEGVEGSTITVAGGTLDVTATDDGLNAAGDLGEQRLVISGGSVRVDAQGDGLDSNGDLTITGGDIVVWGPTGDGDGALDSDGTIEVTGGTLLAVGSAGMAEAPATDSAQGWVSAAVSIGAGQEVGIVDSAGEVLVTFEALKQAGSVVYSSAAVTAGAAYTVLVDGSTAATVTAGEHSGGMGGGPGGGQAGGGQGGPAAGQGQQAMPGGQAPQGGAAQRGRGSGGGRPASGQAVPSGV